jgi:DNA-binding HxlR family transcriptional regulator
LIGDRWTILILRDLFLGKHLFSEILASSPGMPPRVLSARLKRLTGVGLVERAVYSQHPLRTEYRLTAKGRSLFPVLRAIGQWGLDNLFNDEPELRAAVEKTVLRKVPEFQSG